MGYFPWIHLLKTSCKYQNIGTCFGISAQACLRDISTHPRNISTQPQDISTHPRNISTRLQVISTRLQVISTHLRVISTHLQVISTHLQVISTRFRDISTVLVRALIRRMCSPQTKMSVTKFQT